MARLTIWEESATKYFGEATQYSGKATKYWQDEQFRGELATKYVVRFSDPLLIQLENLTTKYSGEATKYSITLERQQNLLLL